MSAPRLILAVDGGGTKTQALVADLQGNVLARGLGPSSNLHNVGVAGSCQAVVTAMEAALSPVVGSGKAPWRTAPIAAACFGLAGVDAPEDEAEISRWVVEQMIAPVFRVVNDAELILAAGTPEGWGVALVSGTGSVCLARSADGQTARVGGWGPLLGDDGSGYEIAIRALRAATHAADGRGPARALLATILAHWSMKEATALIRYVHAATTTAADIASLAPLVLSLADDGDPAAAAIVAESARELARQAQAAMARLRLPRPHLALGGSLLGGRLGRAVVEALPEVAGVTYVSDPPLGGVVLARRLVDGAAPGK